jgi:hypothetical protein
MAAELNLIMSSSSLAVISIYTKTNGKNAKHAWASDAENICATSYLAIQVFEHMFRHQFRAALQDFTFLQAKRFVLLRPSAFLCTLDHEPRSLMEGGNLVISEGDVHRYTELKNNFAVIFGVVQGLLKGKRGHKEVDDDVDSD